MEADRHQGKGDVHRLCQRHINTTQDSPAAGTFNNGRLFQHQRDAFKGLAQQKDGKCRGKVRQRNSPQAVAQAQGADGFVVTEDQ